MNGLQAVEHSWGATKQALDVAQLRISSLRSAKQQSDAQHDRRVQVTAPAAADKLCIPALMLLQLHSV